MKVSKETAGQIMRLVKTGSFSTNQKILDELAEVHLENTGEKLKKGCGDCVRNAMFGIYNESGDAIKKIAEAETPAKKTAAPKAKTAKTASKGKAANTSKIFSLEELNAMELPAIKKIAKGLKVGFGPSSKVEHIAAAIVKEQTPAPAAGNESTGAGEKNEDNVGEPEPEFLKRTLTAEDIKNNPEFKADGLKEGDEVEIPNPKYTAPE